MQRLSLSGDKNRQGQNILLEGRHVTQRNPPSRAFRHALAVGALALLAFALRLYHLTSQGLWSDEGYTSLYARMPLGELLRVLQSGAEPHPLLYYGGMKVWLWLVGDVDFALRFVSVGAATATVPAVYALARRVGGTSTAIVAGLLLAAAPLSVWYGQEARMYALLGLLATVATLRLRLALEHGSWRAWLVYGLSLALALHVHYYALALAALHLYVAQRAVLWRLDRLRALVGFGLAGVLFAPWWFSTHVVSHTGWMEPVDLPTAFRRAAWAFAVGTSVYPDDAWHMAAPLLGAAVLGIVWLLLWRRLGDFLLLAGWAIVPGAAAYLIGALSGRALFHERYISIGAPGFLILAGLGVAGTLGLGGRLLSAARAGDAGLAAAACAARGVLAGGLAAVLLAGGLAADARSLRAHFVDPHFAKEDLRGVAAFLAPRATPDDLLIGQPGRLWLYARYGAIHMPALETDVGWDASRLDCELTAAVAGRRRVWQLPTDSDVDHLAEAWLDGRGYRLDDRWFGLAPLKSWVLADDLSGRAQAIFGPPAAPLLAATAAATALDRARDGYVVRVAATWRKLGATAELKESLRLLDGRGRTVAQADRLLGGDLSPVADWPDGQIGKLRSALRLPPDLPGGRYALQLIVYGPGGALPVHPEGEPPGAEWRLSDVDLAPLEGASPALVEAERDVGLPLGADLRLIGVGLPGGPVTAGGLAPVVLHWQALALNAFAGAPLAATRVGLGDTAGGVPPDPTLGERSGRGAGALLRDDRALRVPRDAAPGWHDLVLRIDGSPGTQLALGGVEIAPARPARTAPPAQTALRAGLGPVSVEGFDLAGEARAGGRIEVVIHFAATAELADDLTTFVHVVGPAGKVVAQHDGPPCGGSCPTETWAPGDRFLDPHAIDLPPGLGLGTYRLVAGLYDPRTGARLPRSDGPPPDQADSVLLGMIEIRT